MNEFFQRPMTPSGGSFVSDKMTGTVIALMGGKTTGNFAYSRDQERALNKLYGFTPEVKGSMLQVGATRNMIHHAKTDGLRIAAFMAQYCDPGEDPLKLIKLALSEYGLDVELEESDFDE